MSGHSKWSTIKRKKGANDAVRGKIFSKISKEIIIAVRDGGADPSANTRLRSAMLKARSENMPNVNIERAIKKGQGDDSGNNFEGITYEGYAPGGVAMLVECLTDNKNRTGPEVRHVFSRNGGNLGETGCVSYMFSRKGVILVDISDKTDDEIFNIAINGGAEDVIVSEDGYEIITAPEDFLELTKILEQNNCSIAHAEIRKIPDSYISVDDLETEKAIMHIIELMEDLDDVQAVSHNFEPKMSD